MEVGLYESLKTSPKLEAEGIWLDIGHTRIKLSRAGGKNTKFIAAAERIHREHKRALEFMNEEQGRKLFAETYAKHIILDWLTKKADGDLDLDGKSVEANYEGARYVRMISGPGGKLIDFTVENIMKVFEDIDVLLRMVKETAEDSSLFRESLLKDVEGNSAQSSVTS